MAASLISYFCTMVTACTMLIAIMNQFVAWRPAGFGGFMAVLGSYTVIRYSVVCEGKRGGAIGTAKGEASAISTASSIAKGARA
jgi:hypothetical protein